MKRQIQYSIRRKEKLLTLTLVALLAESPAIDSKKINKIK
jgi:hypothetical protein